MGIVSQKLRDSARGQRCTFQTSWCNHDPETTVLCHIRDELTGKATKANDWSAAFGCSSCHDAIDQHRLQPEAELFYSLRAMQRTHRIWFDMGLLQVPVTEKRRPTSSKILPRRDMRKAS